jgi:gliding motility-associated-like protein
MYRLATTFYLLLFPLALSSKTVVPPTFAPPPTGLQTTVTTHLDIVDSTDGVVSIREAIEYIISTGSEQTITFQLPQGSPTTILLTDTLPFITNTNLTINGHNQGPNGGVITIQGNGSGQIFNVQNTHLTLDSLCITNGFTNGPGGAILCYQTILVLRHCTFINNQSSYGGAIYCDSYPSNNSRVLITDCHFQNNRSIEGGAISLVHCDTSHIYRSTFIQNTTYTLSGQHSYGGAIHLEYTTGVIDSCILIHNHAVQREQDYSLHAHSYGGALATRNSTLLLTNTTLDSNSTIVSAIGSDLGGALYSSLSNLYIQNCSFNNDTSRGQGGAIYATGNDGSLQIHINQCTFSNNQVYVGMGGAICHQAAAPILINNCTFFQNQTDLGGAIMLQNGCGKSAITNCTFVNNHAVTPNQGGAINQRGGQSQIVNNLFVGNSAGTEPNDIYIRNTLSAKAYSNIWYALTGALTISQSNTSLTQTSPQQIHSDNEGTIQPATITIKGVKHIVFPPLSGTLSATYGIRTAHSPDLSVNARYTSGHWVNNETNNITSASLIQDSIDQIESTRRPDSTSVGAIQFRPQIITRDTVSVCEEYVWHERTLTSSGDYFDTVSISYLWDSIFTLHLTIYQESHNTLNIQACDSFLWNNTNYTITGTHIYNYTNTDGCGSTDTLHLTINPSTHNSYLQNACETFSWHNVNYVTSGTYTYDYTNTNGCASTDTLHLLVNTNSTNTESVTACDQYLWHDSIYTSSTSTPTYTETNNVGCDSIVTLNLTINYSTHNAYHQDACESFTWHNNEYTISGIYTHDYINDDNCPSTDTLHLTISQHDNNTYFVTACDEYEWNGIAYSQSGTYTYDHSQTGSPCTNVDTLYLTINHSTHNTYHQDACESFSWHDANYTATGIYTYDYINNDNCPSTDTLHLTISQHDNNTYYVTACDEYEWNGMAYSLSGTYTYDHSQIGSPCTNVDTLYLTINHSTHNTYHQDACESFTWHDVNYSTTGIYTYDYINNDNCLSTDTLHLTINQHDNNSYYVTACDEYEWNGIDYSQSGIYTYDHSQTGSPCTNVDTLYLTINHSTHNAYHQDACESFSWHEVSYTNTGIYTYDYTNNDGCPSTDTLHLTISQHDNTAYYVTACDEYEWNGVDYSLSGTYTYDHSQTGSPCTNVDTLYLTINHSTHNTYLQDACESFSWHEVSYTNTGIYTYDYTNNDGCPSTDTLHLTVNTNSNYTESVTACDQYLWHDSIYTSSTSTPTFTETNHVGCDSIVTLNLTINYSSHNSYYEETCDKYVWHDTIIFDNGTYTYQYTNAEGCNSTDTLELVIHYSDSLIETYRVCDSFKWDVNGIIYRESSSDTIVLSNQWHCDSVCILVLTVDYSYLTEDTVTGCGWVVWLGETFKTDTVLTSVNGSIAGCDSIEKIIVTVYEPPSAIMTLYPKHLSENQLTLVAEDVSAGIHNTLWIVNGVEKDTCRKLVYEASMVDDSVFVALVINDGYCFDSVTDAVAIWHEDLMIPNVFAPKGNSQENSRFKVFGTSVARFEIKIFNRKGMMVYHSRDIESSWDGSNKGVPCQGGSYVYTINYSTLSDPETIKHKTGSVVLLR